MQFAFQWSTVRGILCVVLPAADRIDVPWGRWFMSNWESMSMVPWGRCFMPSEESISVLQMVVQCSMGKLWTTWCVDEMFQVLHVVDNTDEI